MDFTLTEEQQMIIDSLGKYAENELKPIAFEFRDRLIPKEKMLEIQQSLVDFGVGVGVVSEELGGMGLIRNAVEQGRQALDSIKKLKGLGKPNQLDLVIVGAGPAGVDTRIGSNQCH